MNTLFAGAVVEKCLFVTGNTKLTFIYGITTMHSVKKTFYPIKYCPYVYE